MSVLDIPMDPRVKPRRVAPRPESSKGLSKGWQMLEWATSRLGANQQGIVEPVSAKGCVMGGYSIDPQDWKSFKAKQRANRMGRYLPGPPPPPLYNSYRKAEAQTTGEDEDPITSTSEDPDGEEKERQEDARYGASVGGSRNASGC